MAPTAAPTAVVGSVRNRRPARRASGPSLPIWSAPSEPIPQPDPPSGRPPPHRLAGRDFRRILLVKPSAVGDVIHAVPVLVKLRRRFPNAVIDWVVTPENAELVRHHPALTGVVVFERNRLARLSAWLTGLSAARKLWELVRRLWWGDYDLVLDLQGRARTGLLSLATGTRVRVGFGDCRELAWLAYSHHIPGRVTDAHAVDRNLRAGELLGLDDEPPDFRLTLSEAAERRAAELWAECVSAPPNGLGLAPRPLALLFPGTVWETKHWPPARFAQVGRELIARGWAVAIAGSPSERARCAQVHRDCPSARDLAGRTSLGELAALIRRADLCVTNDSGPMHIAVALGRPVVSVFGPTDPARTGPYRRPEAVVRRELHCSPCLLRTLSRCRHSHACLEGLPAETVLSQIATRLPVQLLGQDRDQVG